MEAKAKIKLTDVNLGKIVDKLGRASLMIKIMAIRESGQPIKNLNIDKISDR